MYHLTPGKERRALAPSSRSAATAGSGADSTQRSGPPVPYDQWYKTYPVVPLYVRSLITIFVRLAADRAILV